MAVSLSVADSQDGTGGVATISGSDAASTNTVKIHLVDATGLTSPSFTTAGSRTGDGAVTITATTGYYWVVVENNDGGDITVSNLVYVGLTDNEKSVHERCFDAALARLQALSFTGLPSTQIYSQMHSDDVNITLPAILLTCEGLTETQPGTLTSLDDIGYPIMIQVCDRSDLAYRANKRAQYLLWRQQIFRAFRNQRLASSVSEVFIVSVEPNVIVDRKLPWYQYFVTGMTLRCMSREVRG